MGAKGPNHHKSTAHPVRRSALGGALTTLCASVGVIGAAVGVSALGAPPGPSPAAEGATTAALTSAGATPAGIGDQSPPATEAVPAAAGAPVATVSAPAPPAGGPSVPPAPPTTTASPPAPAPLPPRPAPRQVTARAAAPTTTTIPTDPDIEPAAETSSPSIAQAWVDAGRVVLLVGADSPVPTLNGDISAGYGWWSYLPLGAEFSSGGHVYRVVNRVWLSVHGGEVARSDFGGDLDLHTCTRSGSTLTWGQLVR